MFRVEKRRLMGPLSVSLRGGCGKVRVYLSGNGIRLRGNGLTLHQGTFRLDVRKNFSE